METMLRTSGSTKKKVRTRVLEAVNGQAYAGCDDNHDVNSQASTARPGRGWIKPPFRCGRMTAV